MILQQIIDDLHNSNLGSLTSENIELINKLALDFLNKQEIECKLPGNLEVARKILNISNILYNNTDRSLLPLEDGVYDLLLEKYKLFDSSYQVGAEPIHFEPIKTQEFSEPTLKKVMMKVEPPSIEDFLYSEELMRNPGITRKDMLSPVMRKIDDGLISKRIVNTAHSYPKLVGTLDKCKFVLNKQAQDKGVFNDNNVKVLERDFFNKHIEMGILNPARRFKMALELKYDGISVEADVSDKVISARTRGDANEGIAADITPILDGYRFKHVEGKINRNETFGMKFEAIMTYFNLQRYNEAKGKDYKNCRTAISGLFASSDAKQYRDFITLVPLATSIEDIGRVEEIEFMNKYYHSGEYLRYTIIEGNYLECLFQIKRFVEEAEYMRAYLPFMYDGVVVSYIEDDLIRALGRINAVNRYSVAIKFNALKKLTTFRGYTFTIGQDGVITPMIHYDPVEFYGTIHLKSTGHSYERFKTLNLRVGDLIEVEYVNDVMPYVTKPDNSHNASNQNPIIPFIDICPSCGNKLKISESGKSIVCDNLECPERNVKRIVSMMQKLNLKDFSEAYISQIAKYSLTELLELKLEDVEFLGDITSQKFIDRMNELRTVPIYDYKIIGSLGFDGIAIEKWKLILNKYTLQEILSMSEEQLKQSIVNIKGIGPITADIICNEFEFFRRDLNTISNMSNVMVSKGAKSGKSIRFTGFRDRTLLNLLNDMGHDATDGGVTKSTDILLIPYENFTSTKLKKVGENTLIIPVNEFRDNMDKYLS